MNLTRALDARLWCVPFEVRARPAGDGRSEADGGSEERALLRRVLGALLLLREERAREVFIHPG